MKFFGIPLGAEIDAQQFKVNFLDVGLSQTVLGLEMHQWLFLENNKDQLLRTKNNSIYCMKIYTSDITYS